MVIGWQEKLWQQTGLLESYKVSVTVRRGDPRYWQMGIVKQISTSVCVCEGAGEWLVTRQVFSSKFFNTVARRIGGNV